MFASVRWLVVRIRRSLATLLLPLSLLAACGDDGGDPAVSSSSDGTTTSTTEGEEAEPDVEAPETHELGIGDNGRSLGITVGDVVRVSLETCPSCGYQWLQMGGGDTGQMVMTESVVEEPTDAAEDEVGGTATYLAEFEAIGPGEFALALGYFPPGDESAPEEVFSVDVTIAPVGDEVNDVLVFDATDNGSTVEVFVDDRFTVALEQCIGCGYSWQVVADPLPGVLTITGEDDIGGPEQVEGEAPIAGGMGEHVIHFEAIGAGETAIELAYVPPGGTFEDAEDRFTMTVEVRG
jgi:predicted secreted protein